MDSDDDPFTNLEGAEVHELEVLESLRIGSSTTIAITEAAVGH